MQVFIKDAAFLFGILCILKCSIGIKYEGSFCKTKDNVQGICTQLHNCKSIYDLILKRLYPFENLVICSYFNHTDVVCCPDSVSPPSDPRGGMPTDTQKSAACVQLEADYKRLLYASSPHIINGLPTVRGYFPHMAGLGYQGEFAAKPIIDFKCGGSLISNRYVLTAAHCLDERRNGKVVLVRLGTTNITDTIDAINVGIEEIIPHPNYTSSNYHNDIGLIRLNQTIEFTCYIYPACLHADRSEFSTGIELTATGWGTTSLRSSKTSELLLHVNLTVVPVNKCYEFLSKERLLKSGLHEGQLCAHDPVTGQDTCTGDSGGPLQKRSKSGLSQVVGVTSYGFFCGSSKPSLYTRVAVYLEDWIQPIVWPSA